MRTESVKRMLAEAPQLAAYWHRVVANTLADKPNRTTLLLSDQS